MATKKGSSAAKVVGFGALGIAGAVGAVIAYNYAKSGGGSKKNAVLVPDKIEGSIDLIVDTLNAKWPDKRWADKGLQAVTTYLESTLPPELIKLVNAVQEAETEGSKRNLSGPEKLALAVKIANRRKTS